MGPFTAMVESQSLQSLPLSALLVDDSRPPQVTYEPQQLIATSTPRATSTESPEISTEAYHQILPGMSSRLYPTWVADSSLDTHIPDNQDPLKMQLTSEVDKYLQEAAVRREMDVNYFDGQHMATNTISHQQKVDSVELEADEIPELIDQDTGKKSETNIEHYIRYNDELETIPEESDEDLPVTVQGDSDKVDCCALWWREVYHHQFVAPSGGQHVDPPARRVVSQRSDDNFFMFSSRTSTACHGT